MFAKCFARIILQNVSEGSGSRKYNHYFPVAKGKGKIGKNCIFFFFLVRIVWYVCQVAPAGLSSSLPPLEVWCREELPKFGRLEEEHFQSHFLWHLFYVGEYKLCKTPIKTNLQNRQRMLKKKTLSFVAIWAFEYNHYLSFRVLSQL